MEGILYVVDEQNNKIFVQIDLGIYGEIWEDFYDIIVAMSRQNDESVPYDQVKEELKLYGKL